MPKTTIRDPTILVFSSMACRARSGSEMWANQISLSALLLGGPLTRNICPRDTGDLHGLSGGKETAAWLTCPRSGKATVTILKAIAPQWTPNTERNKITRRRSLAGLGELDERAARLVMC